MFQFPTFAPSIRKVILLHSIGLPHSEILGLMVICTYPKLIAAYHVLHRLLEPRHPPFALAFFFIFLLTRNSSLITIILVSYTYINVHYSVFFLCNMSKNFRMLSIPKD